MRVTGYILDNLTALKTLRLAEEIDKRFALNKDVFDAIANTDRELFIPKGLGFQAYKLDALPISAMQWISSPLTVAKMTQYLDAQGADRVLEIGCGSGYQAAVLSRLFRGVFTIERIEHLLHEARRRFKQMGAHNIHTRHDDGQNGWIGYAPYDRILFSASTSKVPAKVFEQLSDAGGILIAPIQQGTKQVITRFQKHGRRITENKIEECDFVCVLDGTQK